MPEKLNQKGVIQFFLPLLILTIVSGSLFITSNIQTTTKFDSNVQGVLIARDNDDSSSGSSNSGQSEDNKKAEEQRHEAEKKEQERIYEAQKDEQERIREEKKKEERRGEGAKFEIEIRNNNVKTKIKSEDNRLKIKTEVEDEDEFELEDEDENEGSESAEEELDDLRSISKFPLRIDSSTNQLIMSKNGVERVLTILPEHAVLNMLRAHLKKGLGPKFFSDATQSANPSAIPTGSPSASPTESPSDESESTKSAELTILENEITLEEKDGQVIYKVPAKKHLKLLGFIPITTNLTGFVSAENGSLIEEQQSLLSRVLDFLSP